MFWVDESRVPDELLQLLEIPDVPKDLLDNILQAKREVKEKGWVSYPTKAKVVYYIHLHSVYLLKLTTKPEDENNVSG